MWWVTLIFKGLWRNMFPNLYSYVKVFPFESVKTRCFFRLCKTSWRGRREPFAFLPPGPPSAAVVHRVGCGADPVLLSGSSSAAPTGSFIGPPGSASTLETLVNLSLIYLIKQAFQEKNGRVPVGRREVKGGSPQNCRFWSTSLKTHTRAQGR